MSPRSAEPTRPRPTTAVRRPGRCFFFFVLFVWGKHQQTTREVSINDRTVQNQSFAPAYKGQRANPSTPQEVLKGPPLRVKFENAV